MEDDLKRIAWRIRGWRDEAGLTLQQLGDQSGVSASTIHKIENLQTVPTIAVLLKVANGLSRRPSELLAEENAASQVAVLRKGDHPSLNIDGRGEIEHLAGAIPRNHLDFWRARLQPGMGVGVEDAPWSFDGEVIVLIENGSAEFEISGVEYQLDAGDSIHFDANAPHRWFASGGAEASVLVCMLLPEHLRGELGSRIEMVSQTDASSPSVETINS